MEQDLKLRLIEDKLKSDFYNHKDDIITWILALQKQNYVLSNSLTNLVEKWPLQVPMNPNEVTQMFGILLPKEG